MRRGPLYKTVRAIVVLALAVVIAAFLLKMRPRAERKVVTESGRLVEVFPAEIETFSMKIEAYGTVRPREALDLSAEVRGRVVALHPNFEKGDRVASGDVLVRIDPRTYRLEVERFEAQRVEIAAEKSRVTQEIANLDASIRIAESDAALAKAEFDRLRELSSRKVAAQTTLDKAEQRYLASLERVQTLENQSALSGPAMARLDAQERTVDVLLRRARIDLERTGITAPFEGWIVDKAVEIGSHVNVGQYVGRMYRGGRFEVEVRIPSADMKWFAERPERPEGPPAEVVFSSGDALRRWRGRVARILAEMDAKTRTLPVVVEVDEAAAEAPAGITRLRPGMFVTVEIEGRRVEGMLALPRHVVHTGDVVFVAAEDRLQIRPVSVVRRFGDLVYVDGGIQAGELIIDTPVGGAVDGMKIRVGQ